MSRLVLLSIVFALLACSLAVGSTLLVPGTYASIQAAVDAAHTGDVIIVSPGTYSETIQFTGENIVLRSTAPANPAVVASTIIKSGGPGAIVRFYHGETRQCVLSGFKIQGGGSLSGGGGIYCAGASPTITRCLITGNKSSVGGCGIYYANGSPAITWNTITNNTASDPLGVNGGGICGVRTEGVSTPLIAHNMIRANSASSGGGLYIDGGTPAITDNTITANRSTRGTGGGLALTVNGGALSANIISGNIADQSGGGIACHERVGAAPPAITGNTISNNRATLGGGGLYTGVGCLVTNNIFDRNSATTTDTNYGAGGGVWVQATDCKLINNTFYANSASGYGGGGVFVNADCSVLLRNNILSSHTVGGAFRSAGGTYTIAYNDFYNNSSGNILSRTNIARNPLFADAQGGDFHLKSKSGRWNPATSSWVVDTVHSPCIDAGTVGWACNLEPAPKGGRVNLGFEGNTREASKSQPPGSPALAVTAAATPTASGVVQISLQLSAPASVEVRVLNVAGREIAILPARTLDAGPSTVLWNARTTHGTIAPAGQYLVSLTANTEDGATARFVTTLRR